MSDEEIYLDLVERHGVGEHQAVPPEAVVKEASDPDHPWHQRFDWDDASAAHRYRVEQARRILRGIEITIESTEERVVRGAIHLHSQGGYVAMPRVLSHAGLRAEMLARARQELASLRRKYARLDELSTVWVAIDQS